MLVLFESRLKGIIIFFIIIMLIISLHYVYISVKMKDAGSLFSPAENNLLRGQIYDRDGRILAGNYIVYTVFIDPYIITDAKKVANLLAPFSIYDAKNLESKINENKKRRYLVIAEKIDEETLKKILNLKIKGVYYKKDFYREYTLDDAAACFLGFVDKYNKGLEGIEYYWDNHLSKGENYSIKLTIDSFIQYVIYDEVSKKAISEEADWAFGLVSDSSTGQILAVANWPSFSPYTYSTVPSSKRKNRALLNTFEPGSTFKVFIASALLNEDKIDLNERFFCPGYYSVTENIKIKDLSSHGYVNLEEILQYSCNTGIITSAQRLSNKELYQYFRNFNFGNRTGLDYPAEPEGILKELKKWTKMTKAIINIGQEIGVSAVQMISAFNAIVNGGNYFEPYLTFSQSSGYSSEKVKKPVLIRKVLKPETSQVMKELLVDALKGNSTGKSAYTDVTTVGGKTGTAQVPYSNGKGYDPSQIYTSFIGFFDVNGKSYTVYLGFMNPKKAGYGGTVAAPVFKNIVEKIYPYMVNKEKKSIIIDENSILNENVNENLQKIYERAEKRLISPDIIPDFTGLTLKESIYLASRLGIKLKLSGSGFVYWQSIPPGASLRKGMIIEIRLKF
ncbi:MAG TPA: penicillin-binding protein [Exilispira sp.]|nr:penicillin-binding protein [Exilispira sp.]HQQ19146.1 penicillin-binding protein [Exilispira sp.]